MHHNGFIQELCLNHLCINLWNNNVLTGVLGNKMLPVAPIHTFSIQHKNLGIVDLPLPTLPPKLANKFMHFKRIASIFMVANSVFLAPNMYLNIILTTIQCYLPRLTINLLSTPIKWHKSSCVHIISYLRFAIALEYGTLAISSSACLFLGFLSLDNNSSVEMDYQPAYSCLPWRF